MNDIYPLGLSFDNKDHTYNSKGIPYKNCSKKEQLRIDNDLDKRIDSADLRYPIIIVISNTGDLTVPDGNHRIEKAHRLGYKTIQAKVIPEKYLIQRFSKKLDIKESQKNKNYYNSDGYIKYHFIKDDKYEYMDTSDPLWDSKKKWIAIDEIRVYIKFKGKGSSLLKSFISKIPNYIGILANPNPLDKDGMNFEELKSWYEKLGFSKLDPAGTTMIKS
jgi:hypothetical protein